MKHVGLSALSLACCLAGTAWGERWHTAPPSPPPVPESAVVAPEPYAPWEIYGNGNPYDQSAVAAYNGWPQVCLDGLWDNYCNERHCHCYRGPKCHAHHGLRSGACDTCQPRQRAMLHRGRPYRAQSDCATGGCAESGAVELNGATPTIAAPTLMPETSTESAPIESAPATVQPDDTSAAKPAGKNWAQTLTPGFLRFHN